MAKDTSPTNDGRKPRPYTTSFRFNSRDRWLLNRLRKFWGAAGPVATVRRAMEESAKRHGLTKYVKKEDNATP